MFLQATLWVPPLYWKSRMRRGHLLKSLLRAHSFCQSVSCHSRRLLTSGLWEVCLCHLDGLLRHAFPRKTRDSHLWTFPGLYAHRLSGSVQALLLDAGDDRPFTHTSSNPTSRLPQSRSPLPPAAVSPCLVQKSRPHHLGCVHLYQVKCLALWELKCLASGLPFSQACRGLCWVREHLAQML